MTTCIGLFARGVPIDEVLSECHRVHGQSPDQATVYRWGEVSKLTEIREANMGGAKSTSGTAVAGAAADAISQLQGRLGSGLMGIAGRGLEHPDAIPDLPMDAEGLLTRAAIGEKGAKIAELAKPRKEEAVPVNVLVVNSVRVGVFLRELVGAGIIPPDRVDEALAKWGDA